MKKTYIEPKNTVVALRVRDNVMQTGSPNRNQVFDTTKEAAVDLGGNVEMESREVLNVPDPWDEW